jgi:uncharacterized protein (DUF427 family)
MTAMKNIIPALVVIVMAMSFAGCGKGLYTTSSSGQDNVGYITVITDGKTLRDADVNVVVDGKAYSYGVVYTTKMKRKASSVAVEPGKHNIKVTLAGEVLADEDVFLGLQQTKQFVLR